MGLFLFKCTSDMYGVKVINWKSELEVYYKARFWDYYYFYEWSSSTCVCWLFYTLCRQYNFSISCNVSRWAAAEASDCCRWCNNNSLILNSNKTIDIQFFSNHCNYVYVKFLGALLIVIWAGNQRLITSVNRLIAVFMLYSN